MSSIEYSVYVKSIYLIRGAVIPICSDKVADRS
jgi:hypothetical protein